VWATTEKGLVPGVAALPIDTHGFSDAAAATLSRPDPAGLAADALALVRSTQQQLRR